MDEFHLHFEALQVDHQKEDEDSGKKIGQIGRGVTIESLIDR